MCRKRGEKTALVWLLKTCQLFEIYFWPDQFDDGCVSPRTGMGELGGTGFFAAAKMTHLSRDKTAPKMGHPALR
jgi:hypothetical protein